MGAVQILNKKYTNRWIGRNGPIIVGPAGSPDLTSLDIFLWGKLKEEVYQQQPTIPDDIRNRIIDAFVLLYHQKQL